MIQIVMELLVEGVVVSAFAIIGDLLKSNSFAGLFGAAPLVEPATLDFTVASKGTSRICDSILRRRTHHGYRRHHHEGARSCCYWAVPCVSDFPAVFPASATPIEKREKQKKGEKRGTRRGRGAASV
jgi:hypothetical protein